MKNNIDNIRTKEYYLGDYDIDTIDFFWAGSDAWFENIQRQQKVFVPTADVQTAKEVLPVAVGAKITINLFIGRYGRN